MNPVRILSEAECKGVTFEKAAQDEAQGYWKFWAWDLCFNYDDRYGLAVYEEKRWQAAQSFEDGVWAGAGHADDRNAQHAAMFGHYKALLPYKKNLGRYGEIGCGPFTQTVTIFQSIGLTKPAASNVTSITLVDPLLRSYLQKVHHCSYKDGFFMGMTGSRLNLVSAGGEQITYMKGAFDTVAMMNVIEHVMDAYQVLQNLYNSVRRGGILIFSERWYDAKFEAVKQKKQPFWDLGHPVNIRKAVVEMMLKEFKVLSRNDFYYNQHYPTDEGTYFIGIKK
jgi:SAM-dependent methyltransferase